MFLKSEPSDEPTVFSSEMDDTIPFAVEVGAASHLLLSVRCRPSVTLFTCVCDYSVILYGVAVETGNKHATATKRRCFGTICTLQMQIRVRFIRIHSIISHFERLKG